MPFPLEQWFDITKPIPKADADLTVIANGGTIGEGMSNLAQMVNSAGGTNIGALLEGLGQTDSGSNLIDGIVSRIAGSGK